MTTDQQNAKAPHRVITARMPESMHEDLREEAHERRISMNKLCLAKLARKLPDEPAS